MQTSKKPEIISLTPWTGKLVLEGKTVPKKFIEWYENTQHLMIRCCVMGARKNLLKIIDEVIPIYTDNDPIEYAIIYRDTGSKMLIITAAKGYKKMFKSIMRYYDVFVNENIIQNFNVKMSKILMAGVVSADIEIMTMIRNSLDFSQMRSVISNGGMYTVEKHIPKLDDDVYITLITSREVYNTAVEQCVYSFQNSKEMGDIHNIVKSIIGKNRADMSLLTHIWSELTFKFGLPRSR